MGANKTGEGRVKRGLTDYVYVDVDGTLLLWPGSRPGSPSAESIAAAQAKDSGFGEYDEVRLPKVNEALVNALLDWMSRREAAGARPVIVVWSMGGVEHARMAMRMSGLSSHEGEAIICLAKPDVVIDDAGPRLWQKNPTQFPEEFVAAVEAL